ncbi:MULTISPECIES: transposase [unclassified Streptomyces]|uniref:transposase n=1 Tax=Streptomyces sp. NEAU-sy36 TaxID=2751189 RepID=UPI0027D8D476|nr:MULTISPECIES: transposase [unclassified Streptomyces]
MRAGGYDGGMSRHSWRTDGEGMCPRVQADGHAEEGDAVRHRPRGPRSEEAAVRSAHERHDGESRPRKGPGSRLIDGIRFRIRTGVPWRDAPAGYGPWGRVCDLFRRWQRDGTWLSPRQRVRSYGPDGREAVRRRRPGVGPGPVRRCSW